MTRPFFLKSLGVAMILILLAGISFLKDLLYAVYFGTTAQADLFSLAFFLPDMVGNNLIATALSVVVVPFFTIYHVQGEGEKFHRMASTLMRQIMFLTLTVLLLFYLFHELILSFLFHGMEAELKELGESLSLLFLPTILFFSLAGFAGALLQSKGRVYHQAFAPVLFNAVWLTSLLFVLGFKIPVPAGVYWVAGGIFLGALLMLLFTLFSGSHRLMPFLYPFRTPFRFRFSPKGVFNRFRSSLAGAGMKAWKRNELYDEVKGIARLLLPYLLILLFMQSVLLAERLFASYLEPGTVAGVHYAYRLSQFPLWVFVAAVNAVLLPILSIKQGVGVRGEGFAIYRKATGLVLLISIPFALFFLFGRDFVIRTLFYHGSFNDLSLHITSGILAGYAVSIPFLAVSAVGLRYFLAERNLMKPLVIYFFTSLMNIILDGILIRFWGSPGIGWGMAIASGINSMLLYWVAIRGQEKKMKAGGAYETDTHHYSIL